MLKCPKCKSTSLKTETETCADYIQSEDGSWKVTRVDNYYVCDDGGVYSCLVCDALFKVKDDPFFGFFDGKANREPKGPVLVIIRDREMLL